MFRNKEQKEQNSKTVPLCLDPRLLMFLLRVLFGNCTQMCLILLFSSSCVFLYLGPHLV